MHDGAEEFFATEWPRLADRLGRWLVRRGVPSQEVDDVVQETAFRLLRAWDGLDTTRAVDTLAHTVALNVWRDRATAAARREVVVDDVPETQSPEDVERAVLARSDLAHVTRSFFALPATQQAAVREAVGSESGLPRTAAVRMALMRARRALASGLNGALVFVRARPRRRAAAVLSVAVGGAFVLGLLAPWHPIPPVEKAAPSRSTPVLVLRDEWARHGATPVTLRSTRHVEHVVSAPAALTKPANQPPPPNRDPLSKLPVPPCNCNAGVLFNFNEEVGGVHVWIRPKLNDPTHPGCVEVNGEGPDALACPKR